MQIKVIFTLVSLLGIGFILYSLMQSLFDPRRTYESEISLACAALIIGLIIFCWLKKDYGPNIWFLSFFIVFMLSILPTGFMYVKERLYWNRVHEGTEEFHKKFLIKKQQIEEEVQQRISERDSFSENEAIIFLAQVSQWDLSYRVHKTSYLNDAKELIKKAIEGGILDPNKQTDDGAPLYFAYYYPRAEIYKTQTKLASDQDIFILKTLIEFGADLELKNQSGETYGSLIGVKP